VELIMWGLIPAAGLGTRLQPLAFSKELLPVGSRRDGEVERPRAVSEYLVERMLAAGVDRLCFVIAPGKADIVAYFGDRVGGVPVCYVVQPRPAGLCDALFRLLPLVRDDEPVLVGLPDTIWYPVDGLAALPDDVLSFLLFPVERPEQFDAVVTGAGGAVEEILVKQRDAAARTRNVWGAFKLPGRVLAELHALWRTREPRDEYLGTLVNQYLARGGRAVGVGAGQAYVDVGTLHGYREALALLASPPAPPTAEPPPAEAPLTREAIARRVHALGPWFHDLDLDGVRTAPDHFLHDYPAMKWRRFQHALPADLTGKSVLDIGCNAGFFAMELKRRGAARVLGVDSDERYLAQARFAARVNQLDIEYRRLSVYELPVLRERFDVVLFMGVLYHLRHPLLALDLVHEHVARDLLVFQSMQRGARELAPVAPDYDFWDTAPFEQSGYPRLHFVEHAYAHDATNWWIPNRACAEAMLRSAGFAILEHPEDEVYVCRRVQPG
jgi:tRNA (mo5U34)-methyltransferase